MTRVPIADIVPSPSLQEALAVPQIAHLKKKVNVQRKDLVFTFVQDKELQGEFFVMLVTPAPQAGSSDTPGGFAALPSPKAQAMEKKMIPVLMTPVARRKFDAAGKIEQTHQEYSALVLKVAAEEKLLFIDLDAQSMQLYQQFGVENSKLLFCQLKPGEHPNYPDGKDDNTHFNELGARLIAQLVLKEIRSTIPDLIPYITAKKP